MIGLLAMEQGSRFNSQPHAALIGGGRLEERRASLRFLIDTAAQIRNSSGTTISAMMKNISETGCLVLMNDCSRVEVGRVYCLKLEGLELLNAWAVWVRQSQIGFAFDARLHPAVVKHRAVCSLTLNNLRL
jgi:hypothetical protein